MGTCTRVCNFPYARVDYTYRIWFCSFCFFKNPFPRTYSSSLEESNLPAELFPNYSSVEYGKSVINSIPKPLGSSFSSSSISSLSSMTTPKSLTGELGVLGPAFVFMIDGCMEEDELRGVKTELLRVVESLPENALVGLVTFDGMVNVYDLGFSECSRVVVFYGDRELSSQQIQKFLGIGGPKLQQFGKSPVLQNQSFLLPISECEFSITSVIEEILSTVEVSLGHRPKRSTGVAISNALGLLEGCSVNTGSRIMVFTSGPATLGPGIVVDTDRGIAIRNHKDLINDQAPYYEKSCDFYKRLSKRLCDSSVVLDLSYLFLSNMSNI